MTDDAINPPDCLGVIPCKAVTNYKCNVMSMSMSIYIAHRRVSNALNVPSIDQKEMSSVYDENSQFVSLCPAHANCFGTSSMSLVQPSPQACL